MDVFLQKLIKNTENSLLDFVWKYNGGTKKYTFVIPKHYLNGMNFLENVITFPNGVEVVFDKSEMTELKKSVDISLDRTVKTSMQQYIAENPDTVPTSNPTKQPIEPTQPSTDEKSEEKDDKDGALES